MQISHDQAHRLIQLHFDKVLGLQEKALLFAHLQDCRECQTYASEIQEVESILRPLMKRQWHVKPVPLSRERLVGVRVQKPNASHLLTTRIAAAGVVIVALLFSVWQFMVSGSPSSPTAPIGVPPIPTPSAQTTQSTSTKISFEACQMLVYTVQQADTLEAIAARFSISEAKLRATNDLQAAPIGAGLELVIPICKSTPTGTFDPFTTTFTPILSPTTSTPGG